MENLGNEGLPLPALGGSISEPAMPPGGGWRGGCRLRRSAGRRGLSAPPSSSSQLPSAAYGQLLAGSDAGSPEGAHSPLPRSREDPGAEARSPGPAAGRG